MCVFYPMEEPRHRTAFLKESWKPLFTSNKSQLTLLLMNDSMTRFNLEIILNSSFLRVSGVLGLITGQPSILCNDTVDKPRSVINPQLISAPGPLAHRRRFK